MTRILPELIIPSKTIDNCWECRNFVELGRCIYRCRKLQAFVSDYGIPDECPLERSIIHDD